MVKTGLMRGSVGFWPLVGQTIAFTAPLASVVTSLTGAALYAKGALPLAILIAVISGLIWVNTPYQYSTKIASAGGFYTFTRKAIGPKYGLFDGLIYLMFEYAILANTTLFFSGVLIPAIFSDFFGITVSKYLWIPILIVFVLIFTVLPYIGIKPSVKYALFGSLLEIAILIILSAAIIIISGPKNTGAVFLPELSGGISPLFEGVVLGTFLMTGASGAVYIGEEAKMPRTNIKKAMAVSFVITGALFLLVAYAFTIGWGPTKMGNFATELIPGLILSDKFLGFPFLVVIVILLFNSVFVSMVSPLNVLGRISYSFSRDGVMPPWFVKIHPKYKTPSNAIAFMGISSIVVSVIVGLVYGPFYGYIILITIASLALFAGHIMSDFALPFLYHKLHELNIGLHIILPITSLIVLVFGVYFSVIPPVFPYSLATTATVILIALIGIFVAHFAKKRGKSIEDIGTIEAPLPGSNNEKINK
ncbi:APC family permease [Ferroplasma acidiphilum]|uniref:Amino acid permease related protein n=2 Tax=Ferroplasma TaxID=74968 RepID=S0AR64_FERAC|nr:MULTISPECIES: APC family permease [Ferroplasma]AGO61446.1 amino acid permease related protein [Ferroplasma acidarmanus Fer1]NOL59967.1 APC family permease [Ferroplasma acidiphilum]